MHDPSRVRVSGPLEVFAAGFAVELARMGYRRTPATFQLQLMAHASRWLHGEGLGAGELTSDVVERFLAARRAAGYTNYVTARAMAPLLEYLRGLGVAPAASPRVAVGAVEVLLADYCEYLAVERALTAGTIEGYVLAVRPFLDGRLRTGDALDLAELSAARGHRVRCGAVSGAVARRGEDDRVRAAVAAGVPAPARAGRRCRWRRRCRRCAGWRLAGLPRALEPSR